MKNSLTLMVWMVLSSFGVAGAQESGNDPVAQDAGATSKPVEPTATSAGTAGASDVQPSEAAEPPENLDALTVEDLVAAAKAAVERAEERGSDAQTAVNEASKLATAALSKDPGNLEARYYQARVMLLVNRVYEALPILKEWSVSPAGQSDFKVYQILGDLYRDTYPSLAVPQYETAIRLNDKDVRSYVGMSKALVKLARKAEAVEIARKAVTKDVSDSPSVRAQLVETLIASENLTEAETEAVRVVERSQAIAQSARGNSKPLEDLDEHMSLLISILENRLSTATGQSDDYMGLAQLKLDQASARLQLTYYAALSDLEFGIAALGEAAPAELRAERARLLVAVGRIDDAVLQLQEILSTTPDHPTAKEILQQIESATQRPQAN